MYRLNFLADGPWDEVDDDDRTRVRCGTRASEPRS
jgi:hypothetical protein